MDQNQFKKLLKLKCQLSLNQVVIAGISGGPDSLCMLHLLHNTGLHVIAAHMNHQLRKEADEEANLVMEFCKQRGISFIIERADVNAYSCQHRLSVEESARILRYQFLFKHAEINYAQAVMVAHNADDQVETVLMHLLRGAGLSGLRGMQMRSYNPQWSASIPLVRPLLFTTRTEILAYCENNGLSPSFDKSNEDTKYFRNRIRNSLLPELITYNPQIKDRLLKMSDVLNSEDDFISDSVNNAWDEALLSKKASYLMFSKGKLLSSHSAILRRILRKAFQTLDGNLRDIDYEVLKRAINFLEDNGNSNHLSLIADIEILKYQKNKIILCMHQDPLDELWPQISPVGNLEIDLSQKTILNAWWEIQAEQLAHIPQVPADPMSCILDADKIDHLSLDVFHPGDRFSPFGLAGDTKKLGDYWTNKGLPERARKRWPLVKCSDEIVWIPGFQISEYFKITAKTQRVLALKLIRLKQ
ncbi:MAG: tRNA(Ile)-lysidine synthase [Chloroflexi bacterium]|nr:MAG: tRNA(Ile)-lysidine synthase [Chloroflexota bacterium]MBA4375202.1 tRNA lysidine(34) synthetase TilS [Anaerolinea sp.]